MVSLTIANCSRRTNESSEGTADMMDWAARKDIAQNLEQSESDFCFVVFSSPCT
jgi:hypothetical protein